MKTFYYHNSSQKIVYEYTPNKFDMDFFVPECRIAFATSLDYIDVKSFFYDWNGSICKNPLNDESLRNQLEFLHHKCAAIHDVIRISSAMKYELLQPHNNFQFKFNYDHEMNNEWLQEFYQTNTEHCEKEFNKKLSYHVGRIQEAHTLEEVKSHYRDFWVSTKHVDNYSYNILNQNL